MDFVRRATLAALLICAALAATIAVTTGAQAAGALAIALKDNDATLGLSYGVSYNYAQEGEAKYQAVINCLAEPNVPAEVLVTCRIFAIFHGQCVAVALDKGAGTPGWGWAQSVDKSTAEKTARDNCRAIAGPGRADYCVITHGVCDTKDQVAAARQSSSQVQLSADSAQPQSVSGGRK